MSRRSRSDGHLEYWLQFAERPMPEARLEEFRDAVRAAVGEVCERFGIAIYASDFVVKDSRVFGPDLERMANLLGIKKKE